VAVVAVFSRFPNAVTFVHQAEVIVLAVHGRQRPTAVAIAQVARGRRSSNRIQDDERQPPLELGLAYSGDTLTAL
jgi:hypothetical protein